MERLIQEDYPNRPWEMVVVCILLNQTTNMQVRKVLPNLLNLIKDPLTCSQMDPDLIADVIRPTGFYNIKAKRIVNMSKVWLEGFDDPSDLPGVGKYAIESWEIFVNGNLEISPTDKKLRGYLERRSDPIRNGASPTL
jgi:endonuclease III